MGKSKQMRITVGTKIGGVVALALVALVVIGGITYRATTASCPRVRHR